MRLALPVTQFGSLNKSLITLVKSYNSAPDDDPVQQVYYLQKINELLNRMSMDQNLLNWSLNNEPDGWEAQLRHFGIHPDASFVLKGLQFAQAVAAHTATSEPRAYLEQSLVQNDKYSYELMQARDALLEKAQTYDELKDAYIELSKKLTETSIKCSRLNTLIANHTAFLEKIDFKINAMKARKPDKAHKVASFVTTELKQQINNQNYACSINNDEIPYIIRIEDRTELGLEQKLHSHPVARYFIEDYAVFRIGFKTQAGDIEYRPVVFSQYATQGNLTEIAKKLRDKKHSDISANIGFYFTKLNDFCKQLINTHTYHPDIKLSNFLIHGNRIVVSDRKTFVDKENPRADDVRSSPLFATEEYLKCLNDECNDFNYSARKTRINMPQFMAYQLGMALKEFLILTQQDKLPDEFRDPEITAASYFTLPSHAISNLSILVQELTRENPQSRMTIQQFQEMLNHRNMSTENFYRQLENVFPAQSLGIDSQISKFNELINGNLTGNELISQSNTLFEQVKNTKPAEHRLTWLASKLAHTCFNECSLNYLKQLNNIIEPALVNKDWEKAPWYRKALHWLTAGFFRVSRITKATQAELGELIALTGLNIHIPHLEFISGEHLLKSLGAVATENIWDYITLYVDNYLEATNLEQEQSIDNSSILDDCTSAQEDVELDEDYDSGTIVIKNNSTEQSANDTIVIKSQQEDAEETEDYDTGTMVIKKKSYKALSSETMRVNKSNQLNNSDLSSSIVISDSKATSSDEQRLSVNNSSAAQINALNPISFFSRRKSNTFVRFDTFTTTVKRGDDTLTELFKRHHQIKPHVAHIQWGTDTLKSPRNSLSLVSPSNPEDSISFNI